MVNMRSWSFPSMLRLPPYSAIAFILAFLLGIVPTVAHAAEAKVPAPAHAKTTRQGDADRLPLVVVRALGPVEAGNLRAACRTLLQRYPLRCEVQSGQRLFDTLAAWNADRAQLDARQILDLAFRMRTGDALVELWVTELDMYDQGKPFVFGLASVTDRVGIVSLARIVDPLDNAVTEHRLNKLVLHEVGHAIGLPHHAASSCVMRQDPSTQSLDTAPEALCSECHATLAAQAQVLARPGQVELDRTRGHLVRSEVEAARFRAVRALWDFPSEPELVNAFALAFMEARQWNEAISLLGYALDHHPDYAEAHLNRGIALQMRNLGRDVATAIGHYERAARLRPEWAGVARHVDELRHHAARAQGPELPPRP